MIGTSAPDSRRDGFLDEATRPLVPASPDLPAPGPAGLAVGRHFLEVHDRYRAQMREVLDLLGQLDGGEDSLGLARGSLHELAVRANDWMVGGYCQRQCHDLTEHHGIEDQGIFPHLRASDPDLAPVLDRLDQEHRYIHDLLGRVDATLVQLVSRPHDLRPITALLGELDATITSHFAYEEDQLIGPLQQHGFYQGQLAGRT